MWSVCLLLLLAPLTLNLTRPGTNLIQERYLYLPSAAACLGIARFLVPRTGRPSRASPVVLVGLLLMYGALLVVNLPPWRDARSLWSHQVRVNDRWPVAQGNLAQVLLAQGEPGEACSRFELALALAREQRYTPPEFLLGLGRARLLLGHLDAAEPALLEARRIRADLPRLAANLAFLYLKRGEPDRATPHLEEAMALDRHDVASGVNLAQIYLRRREVARALGLVDALIRENPEDPRLPVLRRSLVGRPPETVR
ncbi:MAG: tetratricopeptide repeat protein [Candidatus Riflebacteria bacterium]|nr:tetratricopeptide repeat protein [Candidatus Riflebacteria bacterium]